VSSHVPDPAPDRDRRVGVICRVAVAVAIAGVFGTWRNAGNVSLDGFEGPHNGWLVIIFGLIALTGVRALTRGSWFGVITVIGCAAVMVFAAVQDIVDDGAALGGSSGWGVWLTVAASGLLGASAALVAVRGLRPSPAATEPADIA
jgi:hypothetical protein